MTLCKTVQLSEGQKIGKFLVERIVPVEELQCELIELRHEPTGAAVMHIAADDPENLFCLSLKTTPDSSNGVAHILEHTVLCGSKKFPVRDPFFSMNRRSLNTFMNAMTGSDFTCYPASSQVKKDFYNLLEVYIDAVFHPRLDEQSFRQEGHRLEFATGDDPASPLEYKGVVFNEMKGVLASPERRMWEAFGRELFPGSTYGVNSGGAPEDIPSLTHEQLKDFHKHYYHPSRCTFFFYGDIPLQEHLDFIEKHALAGVKPAEPLPTIALQPRFTEPVVIEESFPIAKDEDTTEKGLVCFGWLTVPIEDQSTLLALSVLDLLLTGTDAAPLKKALLRSGLCKGVGMAMEDDIREVPMILLLRDCNPDNAQKIEELVWQTLETCANEGFAERRIEAALHQLELDRVEISGDNHPFGLTLYMRSALLRQHGVAPEKGLFIHELFDELRQRCSDPNYLPSLIRTYLLENPHRLRLTMRPDKELEERERRAEEQKLEQIRNGLSLEEQNELLRLAKELEEIQDEAEDEALELLPKVTLSDVPEKGLHYPLQTRQEGDVKVLYHEAFTNRMIMADLVFDMPAVREEELLPTKLFSLVLANIGCGGRSYAEVLEYQEEHTGGVRCSLSLNPQAGDPDLFRPACQIKGKVIRRKADKLMPLIHDMICSPDFSDKERLRELLTKHYSGLHASITNSPLSYAINLAGKGLSVGSRITEAWYGLEYFHGVQDLVQNFDTRIDGLIEHFEKLRARLLSPHNLELVLTCDQKSYETLVPTLAELQGLPTAEFKPWTNDFSLEPTSSQARLIAAPVSFTAKVFRTVPSTHPDAPLLGVASFLMDNKTLHKRIREQGGAYGGGCNPNPMAGKFTFYSYRDPNIVDTLEAFDESVHALIAGKFADQDLEEAKLEVIQQLDSPVAPGSRGITEYGWLRGDRPFERRQAYRQRLLEASAKDVMRAAAEHLKGNMDSGAAVTFAGKELIESENKRLTELGKQPFEILPI